MTSVRGRGRPRKERLSVTPSDSFPPPESGDELFDQPARPPGANLPVAVVPVAIPPVPKYTKKDLQRILKTVLEARAPTTSEKPWDKPLKARSSDVYRGKSHMECYNFC